MKMTKKKFGKVITGSPDELQQFARSNTSERGQIFINFPWIDGNIKVIYLPYERNNWFYVITRNVSYFLPYKHDTANAGIFGDIDHFRNKYEALQTN
jgi:hypothetical protein